LSGLAGIYFERVLKGTNKTATAAATANSNQPPTSPNKNINMSMNRMNDTADKNVLQIPTTQQQQQLHFPTSISTPSLSDVRHGQDMNQQINGTHIHSNSANYVQPRHIAVQPNTLSPSQSPPPHHHHHHSHHLDKQSLLPTSISSSTLASSTLVSPPNAGTTELTLWDRNVQLSFWGVIFGMMSVCSSDTDRVRVSTYGFFYGYSSVTWLVIVLSSIGGLMVSLVVKYADNIMKGFATTFAIVLTSLCSWLYFNDLHPDIQFVCGVAVVIIAVFNYTLDPTADLHCQHDKKSSSLSSDTHCGTCSCMEKSKPSSESEQEQQQQYNKNILPPVSSSSLLSSDEIHDNVHDHDELLGSFKRENANQNNSSNSREIELTKRNTGSYASSTHTTPVHSTTHSRRTTFDNYSTDRERDRDRNARSP